MERGVKMIRRHTQRRLEGRIERGTEGDTELRAGEHISTTTRIGGAIN